MDKSEFRARSAVPRAMTPDEIFAGALEQTAAADRRAFLDAACGTDAELRARIERLLRAHEETGHLLDRPLYAAKPSAFLEPAPELQPGAVIGPYRLLQHLGEGGMGTVYMAEQSEPVRRRVALKIIRPGMASAQSVARFEAERQALALMDHPNIARVFDAGTVGGGARGEEGRPYFVMELVKGVPITQHCDEHRLPPTERLQLFASVCQAVQHAHQKGVIHRDLKPSNVLVALYDGRPVPKVIDFGVAKALREPLTERTMFTEFGQVVGTLEYMSPEQAELNQLDVDTRSDIYSLGVLLYELLTGTTPLERGRLQTTAFLEALRLVREEEPPPPSARLSSAEELPRIAANRGLVAKRLGGLVRGELDWIVMKCLEKDRDRRYETANSLARDVQRFLAHEPVFAGPPSTLYRFRKFARRNRRALATGLVVAVAALVAVGAVAGSLGWAARDRAARRTTTEREVSVAVEEATLLAGQAAGLTDNPYPWEATLAAALSAAKRAEALAAHDAAGMDPHLLERVREVRARLEADERDRRFLAEFERIRLEAAQVDIVNNTFRGDLRFSGLCDAFRAYGIQFGATPGDVVLTIVRGRPRAIGDHLLSALYYCFYAANPAQKQELGDWFFAMIRTADADPWRHRLVEAITRSDAAEIARLFAEVDPAVQPPAFLDQMARAVAELAPEASLAMHRRVQRSRPDDFWANHSLAFALHHRTPSRPAEAVRYYSAALALRPRNSGILVNMGVALAEVGDQDAAIDAYDRALVIDPDYAIAHNNRAAALDKKGDMQGALEGYRRAVALAPKLALAHLNLGAALGRSGSPEECMAEYQVAIDCDPQYGEAYFALGKALASRDVASATAKFRKALELGYRAADVHSWLAMMLQPPHGTWDDALAEHEAALRLDPRNRDALVRYGDALDESGRWQDAIVQYERLLAVDPRSMAGHNNLGDLLSRHGDPDAAIAHFRIAIASDPAVAEPHHNMGSAYRRKHEFANAEACYRRAVAIQPDFHAAHLQLGVVLRLQGRFADALTLLTEARQRLPSGHPLRGNFDSLIRAVRAALRFDESLPAILAGSKKPRDGADLFEYAHVCFQRSLYRSAARLAVEAFASNPELVNAETGEFAYRFKAALAAALAGTARGADAEGADEAERARWRAQALTWLEADLAAWQIQFVSDDAESRAQVRKALTGWIYEPDLAGLRGDTALAKVPEGERAGWLRLWEAVQRLFERAQEPATPAAQAAPGSGSR